MVAINNTLPRSEGEISRVNQALQIESMINTGATDMNPGLVVVSDGTTDKGIVYPSTASNARKGILVRDIRQGDTTGAAPVKQNQVGSVIRMGYVMVKCVNGTPVDGAKVYYRYALGDTGSTSRPIGSIEAAAITNEVIEMVGATFNGTIDENGLVEVRINL